MSAPPTKFTGWVAHGPESIDGKMKWEEFEPKPWDEDMVDIEITHSGMCGSELHTLRSGWGATPYPIVVGHEIVGRAIRVGSNVTHQGIKVGDTVGVGAQCGSCLECEQCTKGEENHCTGMVNTYHHMGGYAVHTRKPGSFCFKIPAGLDPAAAAPMMCGGVTVYTPLVEAGCGPGKTVGIIGTGGLGHFAVLFARALGADRVVGFSRRQDKAADVKAMGADDYVATEDGPDDWEQKYARKLDIIVSTVSSPKMPINKYLTMLAVRGKLLQVGAPEDIIPGFNMFSLIPKSASIGGSIIGNRKQIEEMLQLAADKKVKAWIQKRPMAEANEAIVDFVAGKPRYRYVLVN